MKKSRFRFLALLFMIFCLMASFTTTALATSFNARLAGEDITPVEDTSSSVKLGWVEFRATVPDGFSGVVVVTFINQETEEDFAVDILSVNQFKSSASVPEGEYYVQYAFVYQDLRYRVVVDKMTFSVVEDGAAALINLTVNGEEDPLPAETTSAGIEPTSSTDVSESSPTETFSEPTGSEIISGSAPTDDSTAVEEDMESSQSGSIWNMIGRWLLILLGSGIFMGLVFVAALLYRRHISD